VQIIIPHYYQEEACDAIFRYYEDGGKGNPVVAMPTGTGKSIVIGMFIQRVFQAYPFQRVMMLTHVKELIEQNCGKLETLWPAAPVGIFSAGLGQKVTGLPITFAGVQSAVKAALMFGKIDLVIIDECHLVSPEDNSSYQKLLTVLKTINPKLKVVGFSATPFRLGLGMITDGGIFTHICYNITGVRAFTQLIDDGFLCPLVPRPTTVQLDLSGVGKRGGEFIEAQLQFAVDKDEITRAAIREALERMTDRNYIMVFASGVQHAENITRVLREYGQSAVCAHSKMGKQADKNKEEFGLKMHRFIVSNNQLTTGVDYPHVDGIIMLRPTASPGLWVQMLGRGTRVVYYKFAGFDISNREHRLEAIRLGGKLDCLVLDFAGNTLRLGPINDPSVPRKKGEGTGEIPIKICDPGNMVSGIGCGAYNHISARWCCGCKQEFSFKIKISHIASTRDLIVRDEPVVEILPVDRVTYMVHHKKGVPPSLKVSYYSGINRYTEFVVAWHPDSISARGRGWWKKRTDLPLPDSAEKANELVSQLKIPKTIRVWSNKKYPEVLSYEFD
jgi:DNA repair protein RadD